MKTRCKPGLKTLMLVAPTLFVLTGCDSALQERAKQADLLDQENQQIRLQINQERQQLAQANQQLQTLRGFTDDRAQYFITAAGAEFGRFTGPFDDNKDGIDDGLNIYLVIKDRHRDTIKAAGQVQIELWDLAAPQAQRQLGSWTFPLDKVADYWLSGLMADHYKFKLPWPDNNTPHHTNLTIKLRFKDAMTGTEFELQKLIKVAISL